MWNDYNERDLLSEILECGTLDIDFLLRTINKYKDSFLDYDPDLSFFIKEMKRNDYFHLGAMLDMLITDILYKFIDYFKSKATEELNTNNKNRVITYLENLSFDFQPFINYLDSYFNNILDEVNIGNEEEVWKTILIKTVVGGY